MFSSPSTSSSDGKINNPSFAEETQQEIKRRKIEHDTTQAGLGALNAGSESSSNTTKRPQRPPTNRELFNPRQTGGGSEFPGPHNSPRPSSLLPSPLQTHLSKRPTTEEHNQQDLFRMTTLMRESKPSTQNAAPAAFVRPSSSARGGASSAAMPVPDFAACGFTTSHRGKKMPATPSRTKILTKEIPSVTAAKDAVRLLSASLGSNTPMTIEIAPSIRAIFTGIKFLSEAGDHSYVYKCQYEGQPYVLKTYKTEDEPKIVSLMTCQFMRYCQSRNYPRINTFLPQHSNFEPYYQTLLERGFFKDERNFGGLHQDLKSFVRTEMKHGLIVMPFVAQAFFPREFNPTDPAWESLKTLFQLCHETGICHDLNRDNIHLDERSSVKLIDLYERDEGDHFDTYSEKYMDSYDIERSDDEKRDWLCPWRKQRDRV